MRYRVLGKSGVRISEVALGTMTFGEDWGWGAPPEVSARMLDLFADAGGNVIDTADVYTGGTSETILGELLKGRRDRFVLGTKFTNQTDPGDPNSAGNHRKKIVTSIEASLRRLQTGHTDRVTEAGRPYTHVGSDDIVREVVAISRDIGCSPAQVAISWVRQQPGPVIPLIAARTEEQFRDNLAATDVHLSQQHLDRLDALSRPTLGFPADVMREASVVAGVYGAQLPDIDDPRAQALRRTTTGT